MSKAWKSEGGGVYRHVESGKLYQRPTINGKRTWRVLNTDKLTDARKVVTVRLAKKLLSKEGLERDPDLPAVFKTVGEALRNWQAFNCPGRNQKARKDVALYRANRMAGQMLAFWDTYEIASIRPKLVDDYANWRRKTSPKTAGGTRLKSGICLKREMEVLHYALELARRQERLDSNPLRNFARMNMTSDHETNHCREYRPRDAEELHLIARKFFEDARSEVLGWQLLIEAMTGMRTSEVLDCRMDAKTHGQPGFIDGDVLHINRRKQGVNPYVVIHPALRECLDAFFKWHQVRFPNSPWWFPSSLNETVNPRGQGRIRPPRSGVNRVRVNSLNSSLCRRIPRWLGEDRKVTSHSLRAYYVTARRSELIPDVVIAAEIGDKTGAAIIVNTYGDLPPNWSNSKAGKITWLPASTRPAWEVFSNLESNIISLHGATQPEATKAAPACAERG